MATGSERLRVCQFSPYLGGAGLEERLARLVAGMAPERFIRSWMAFGPGSAAATGSRFGGQVETVLVQKPDARPALGLHYGLLLEIAWRMRRMRPDVVHVHNWGVSAYGILGARLAGVPTVLYGTGGRESPTGASPRQRAVMRTLAPHVDRFTAVCDFLGGELAADWGVPRARVAVLPTGIDVARIEAGAANRDQVRRRYGLPANALVVGALGMLRPVKRTVDLVEAIGPIAAGHDDVHLLLVGGALRVDVDALKARAAALGYGPDRIHIRGAVDVAATAEVIHAFDIVVNCSEFEGTSNAIIEAMAAGKPIVATAVGGTPELVRDGVTGLLVPPKDPARLGHAIERLITNPALRTRLAEAARAAAGAHHRVESMVSQYESVYLDAAAERRTRWPTRALTATTGLARGIHALTTR